MEEAAAAAASPGLGLPYAATLVRVHRRAVASLDLASRGPGAIAGRESPPRKATLVGWAGRTTARVLEAEGGTGDMIGEGRRGRRRGKRRRLSGFATIRERRGSVASRA